MSLNLQSFTIPFRKHEFQHNLGPYHSIYNSYYEVTIILIYSDTARVISLRIIITGKKGKGKGKCIYIARFL